MVTSYNGVKGPKQDPTIAGSNIQYLALNVTIPLLVIKDPILRKTKPDHCYRFAKIDALRKEFGHTGPFEAIEFEHPVADPIYFPIK